MAKSRLAVTKLITVLRQPGFWLIAVSLVLISLPHYYGVLRYPPFLVPVVTNLGLERQAFERILFLAPVVWAGFIFGWKGAFITSLVALGLMLPRAVLISNFPKDALFESSAVFIIGNVLAISFHALRKEREYRIELEVAQKELEENVRVITEDEKRLAALNQIATTVSQSLELDQILTRAVARVASVMQADITWIYLLDEKASELLLSAHWGMPPELAVGIDRLKPGEGFNGRVAQSGEPLVVENASKDPRLTREAVSKLNICSLLIVPLSSKGKVNGTLCAAYYQCRIFQQGEIDLLGAIGKQIGVAVENAHLYLRQQKVAEEQKHLQENLRYYLREVTKAQEEERKRISRELHDETIQSLVVLSRRLDVLASNSKGMTEEARLQMEELREQVNDTIQSVRRLSQDLRPAALDRLGLLPALEWLATDAAKYSGISTSVKVIGTERRLSEEVELVLFRITQEALRNVWRHSQATKAEITVRFDESRTCIIIADNGKGFKLSKSMSELARDGKLGLAGMQERAQLLNGTVTVESEPGKGTRVIVDVLV